MSVSTPSIEVEAPVSSGIAVALSARALLFLTGLSLLVSCDTDSESPLTASRLTLSQPCDLRQGCRASDASTVVTVTFAAEARALQPFPVRVQLDNDRPADSVSVSFSMQGMDMGSNRYRLAADSSGGWSGEITLPICASGRTDWVADFEFVLADRRLQLQVPFVLKK